jgi:hypothetical protein
LVRPFISRITDENVEELQDNDVLTETGSEYFENVRVDRYHHPGCVSEADTRICRPVDIQTGLLPNSPDLFSSE